jgi:hypothetical protein
MRLLVIEDNRQLVANLFDYFESRGHVLDVAPMASPACTWPAATLRRGDPGLDAAAHGGAGGAAPAAPSTRRGAGDHADRARRAAGQDRRLPRRADDY